MECLLGPLALANIKHEAAKLDGLSVSMLASDDVMDPDSLPRCGNHAIFKFRIFGTLTKSQASADRKLLVIRIEMRNQKIFSIPLFDWIAEQPDSLRAYIGESP